MKVAVIRISGFVGRAHRRRSMGVVILTLSWSSILRHRPTNYRRFCVTVRCQGLYLYGRYAGYGGFDSNQHLHTAEDSSSVNTRRGGAWHSCTV